MNTFELAVQTKARLYDMIIICLATNQVLQ